MSGIALPEEAKKVLIKILGKIASELELNAIALITRDGLRVAFYSEKQVDPDLFSAAAASTIATGSMISEKFGHGRLMEITVRGEDGYTVIASAGENLLIAGTGNEVTSMGLVIQKLRETGKKIAEVLG